MILDETKCDILNWDGRTHPCIKRIFREKLWGWDLGQDKAHKTFFDVGVVIRCSCPRPEVDTMKQ